MSSPATSVIHMASAAAAAMLLLAGMAFQLGSRDDDLPAALNAAGEQNAPIVEVSGCPT